MAAVDYVTAEALAQMDARVTALEKAAAPAPPAKTYAPITEPFGRTTVSAGRFFVQNNRWGSDLPQAVQPRDGGFTLTRADGDIAYGGAPKSYPAIVIGQHYGAGTTGVLPVRVADLGQPRTSASITRAPGSWNAAYDIWLNSAPDSPGENDDTEIMLWMDTSDRPTPIGKVVGAVSVEGAAYTVWQGKGRVADVVSFVRDVGVQAWDVPLRPFVDECVRRGAASTASYLTSVQLGFEPWKGGTGLAVDGFTYRP